MGSFQTLLGPPTLRLCRVDSDTAGQIKVDCATEEISNASQLHLGLPNLSLQY